MEDEGLGHSAALCPTHHPHQSLFPCMSLLTGLPNPPPRAAAHFYRITLSPLRFSLVLLDTAVFAFLLYECSRRWGWGSQLQQCLAHTGGTTLKFWIDEWIQELPTERGQLLPQKAESSPRLSMGRRGSRAQPWGTPESEGLVS